QILAKPGPSGENQSQDSLQGWSSKMEQVTVVDTTPRLLTKNIAKTFDCSVCGKVFRHPKSLRQHRKTHTGETKCPVCYMVMSRKYELRVHLRKRHNIIQSSRWIHRFKKAK
ncbi:hypothetical protein L9F63_018874, partial [Diploptera punctata]